MCFGGSPPSVPLPAPAPQMADPSVAAAGEAELARRRAAASNTDLTGPQGAGGQKSLLGT